MKTGKSISELAAEIERQANAKQDFVAPVGKVAMTVERGAPALAIEMKDKPAAVFPINTLSHGQLAEYTGIPKAYYDRLQADPDALAFNVNHWLRKNANERRMIRTLDGNVRAFLSDRFRPLENEQLAEAILPPLLNMNLMVISSEITERRLYIKAVSNDIKKDVPVGRSMGDGSHVFFRTNSPGITISNSEVGYGRLLVETTLFDHVCTNLAMSGTSLKRQHVGGRAEVADEVYAVLSDSTKRLTDAAIWSQVGDVVRNAFNVEAFNKRCEALEVAAGVKIEDDPVVVVERVAKQHGFADGVRKSILQHLIEGANLSKWGLSAAITRASADVEDYDQATEMERIGGQVIELPRNEWQALAAAA